MSLGGNPGFSDRDDFSYFNLQATPIFPTKFQVNWPFGSGGEAKNGFSKWPPWRSYWIFDGTILAIFDLQVISMLPTKFRVKWPKGVEEVSF